MTTPLQDNFTMPTLFGVYEPIESYLDAMQAARGGQSDGDRSALSLGAIDFFLLHQWIAQYPMRPRVIDLASEATQGASTLFFLGNPQVREVLLPALELAAGTPDWRPLLDAALADRKVSPQPGCRALAANGVGEFRRFFREDELQPPLLVLLHVDEKESYNSLENTLEELFALHEDVVVAACPLGRIGRCGVLASLIAHCASRPEHRLAALREICPFTATSQLGILYRASNAHADEMLECLGHWFDGNFQFLSLVRELTTCHLASASLAAQLAAQPNDFEDFQRSEAWREFGRFQQIRQRFLPPGSRRESSARALLRTGRRAAGALRSVASRFRKAA